MAFEEKRASESSSWYLWAQRENGRTPLTARPKVPSVTQPTDCSAETAGRRGSNCETAQVPNRKATPKPMQQTHVAAAQRRQNRERQEGKQPQLPPPLQPSPRENRVRENLTPRCEARRQWRKPIIEWIDYEFITSPLSSRSKPITNQITTKM